jgi:hypothetical protein
MTFNKNGADNNAEWLAVGGDIIDSNVSLCIYALDIDIEAISNELKCQPTKAHKRGYKKNEKSVPARNGLWMLDAPKAC